MNYSVKLRGRLIISVVSIVITLVIVNTLITTRNNEIIAINRKLQKEAESVKVIVSQFAINIIHNLDLGLRSYALFNNEKYLPPLEFALRDKDSLIQAVETTLRTQQYPMKEFLQLKDSINSYAAFCLKLKELNRQDKEKFLYLADLDKGYQLWLQYEQFATRVYQFEDRINEEATRQYEDAVFSNYLFQLILFLISVPALLIMAGHTRKKFALVEQLHQMDIEKAEILAQQNAKLELMVQERTTEVQGKNLELSNRNDEIATQNEELTAQREQIAEQRDLLIEQNDELKAARKTIEEQNQLLEKQIEERTNQLVQYNQQLERFTYMAAHDLRGPVARILGLGRLLSMEKKDEEKIFSIVEKLIQSTLDLDQVVNDLGRITEIKQEGKLKISEINFTEELIFLKSKLKRELFESKAKIEPDFSVAPSMQSSKKYFRNILYQILHNAIKFRHPERNPIIIIKSEALDSFILLTVSDNGIGINIEKYRDQLFQFHKRFHDHVEGRGLGLYLARIQIVALGGEIEIDSQEGIGTKFKLYFRI